MSDASWQNRILMRAEKAIKEQGRREERERIVKAIEARKENYDTPDDSRWNGYMSACDDIITAIAEQ